MISPEWDEIVGERGAELSGAELSGAVCCDFEQWSGGSEHPRERGAEILTAQLRSHALVLTILFLALLSSGIEFYHTDRTLGEARIHM